MLKRTILALSLTSVLFAIGCDKTKAPGAAGPDPLSPAAYPRQVALERLHKYIVVGTPTVRSSVEQPLSVEVPFRALTDKDLHVQYKFEFFDGGGRLLKPEMGWRYKEVMARAQDFVSAAAMDGRATDWRLTMRPAR